MWRNRIILIASLMVFVYTLLISTNSWLCRATAPAPQPRALLQLSMFGARISATAWPARPGTAGYIDLWVAPPGAGEYQPLLQVFGAPALPVDQTPPDPEQLLASTGECGE